MVAAPAVGPVDGVLVSHVQMVHLHVPSLRRLDGDPEVVRLTTADACDNMDRMIEPARAHELADIVAMIAAEQVHSERCITYLGVEPTGIRAELDDLDPAWSTTVRVVRDGDQIVGATLVDWDVEIGRSWIHGPWIAGDADAWARWARPLVDAAVAQLPAGIDDHELAGDVANQRLAGLAAELGWEPTEVNYALQLTAARAAEWAGPAASPPVRDLVEADIDGIRELHDTEFPKTYLPAERIATESAAGTRVAVVTEHDGEVSGYATGAVTPDGDGFIDFVAVHESARGTGAGGQLVRELSRRLLAGAPNELVNLTVQEHRAQARAVYERLGFFVEAAFVGYRPTPTA